MDTWMSILFVVVPILLALLPMAWWTSEFQPRRWVRITLGVSSLALSFSIACAVGMLPTKDQPPQGAMIVFFILILILLVVLPVAWLISEFQPRREMRIRLGACSLALSFFVPWVVGTLPAFVNLTDQPPPHDMIEQAYHYCEKCGSLEGGIYGKGPFKSFPGEGKKECIHEWKTITRGEFKRIAVEKYGVDWNKEIPFWQ
jgi:hypothetical protein